jgi:hypothetical protein
MTNLMADCQLEEVEQELFQLETQCDQLREAALEKLEALLSKKNFARTVDRHVTLITGSSACVCVNVDHQWDTQTADDYTMTILFDADIEEWIDKFVLRVFPNTIRRDISYSHEWKYRYEYSVVSASKLRAMAEPTEQHSQEDAIRDKGDYISYILRNNLEGAHSKFLGHLLPGDYPEAGSSEWVTFVERNVDVTAAMERTFRDEQYENWNAAHRRSMWCNLHGRLLELCIALAPLHLSSYELLWILDYLPPMNFKCYKDGRPYDANHLRKLRLYEGVMRSYKIRRP